MSIHKNIEKKIHIFLHTAKCLRLFVGMHESAKNAGMSANSLQYLFKRDIDILRGNVVRCFKCEERIERQK